MKYKSVIAFGDSHVAGCELSQDNVIKEYLTGKITLEQMDNAGKPLSFANTVAAHLGVPCYNYGLSGGSNERSMRLLPQALAEHPDSLVLFGYTAQNRREFYYDDAGKLLGRDADNFLQVGIQWYNTMALDVASKHGIKHPINTMFVEKFMRWCQGDHTSILNAMFYAEQASKGNIVHIFFFRDLYDKGNVVNGLLDHSNILNFNGTQNDGYGSYQEWADAQGHSRLPMGHFDKTVHDKLAQLILDHLNSDSTK